METPGTSHGRVFGPFPLRFPFSFGVVAAYTCCMFCERKFSVNTILRLSKMSVHAEFPRESQFY
jgi:hypothetical protein